MKDLKPLVAYTAVFLALLYAANMLIKEFVCGTILVCIAGWCVGYAAVFLYIRHSQCKQISQGGDDAKTLEAMSKQISEWKRKEKSMLEHALDVICSIDINQKFLSVNQASLKVWGYKPDELIGNDVASFLVDEDRKGTLSNLIGAEKSADTINFENRLKTKDGKTLDLLWSAHWSVADQALFCVVRDISERKSYELSLKESEARIREIFSRMPVGLLIVNRSGFIEQANATAGLMCALSQDELIGKSFREFLPDLDADFNSDGFAKTLQDKDACFYPQISLKQQSGAQVLVQVSVSKTKIRSSQKFLFVLVDMSEREELEKAKRQFMAMVSHELRSPLTSLGLSLSLLTRPHIAQLSDSGKLILEKNSAEVERLIRLVNDLLDIEKMQAGKFQLHMQNTRLNELVQRSFHAIQHLADTRRIKLNFRESEIICFCDGARVIQVLINLLSNAIKVSASESEVNVEACLKAESEGADVVVVCVRDRGPGIAEKDRALIFESFEQGQGSGQGAHAPGSTSGTGLGLPISKAIVEQHGGRMWLECPSTGGSEFYFSLKAAPNEESAVVEE